MKKMTLIFALAIALTTIGTINSYAYTCGPNKITYTSSNPWISANGTVTADGGTRNNDWVRLNWMLTNCVGKIIFDEGDYYLGNPPSGQAPSGSAPPNLPVYSYRILEGNGRKSAYNSGFSTSRIVQTVANSSIFTIGPNVYDVSIRDLAMVGTAVTSGENSRPDNTVGILATSTCLFNCSSIGFQFSNLKFSNLSKGIYVNADDPPSIPGNEYSAHQWQFDNIQLDHAFFEGCTIGIHVNSYNSGWNIKSADFLVPTGDVQETDEDPDDSITDKTYGIYFERITYSSLDSLIGNGPSSNGPDLGTSFIYVKQHANLNIQNIVSEGFYEDLIVHGVARNSPINLMNNTIQSGVRVKMTTLYSSSNQYTSVSTAANADGLDSSQIYSIGDKYCVEGTSPMICDEGRGYSLDSSSKMLFSTNQAKNFTSVPTVMSRTTYNSADLPLLSLTSEFSAVPLFRIGVRGYNYDFSRSETDGKLVVLGTQNGYSGYSFETCQSCSGNPPTGTIAKVTINNNGSVTLGNTPFSTLYTAGDGTLIYCTDCQESDPCSGSGSGAMAKRINGRWDCN